MGLLTIRGSVRSRWDRSSTLAAQDRRGDRRGRRQLSPGFDRLEERTVLSVIAPDANTVLLDHFDGSTLGTAVGDVTFAPSQSGMGMAVSLSPGSYVNYALPAWYGSGSNTDPNTQGTIEMWVDPKAYGGLLDLNWYQTNSYPPDGHVVILGLNSTGALEYDVWNFQGSSLPNNVVSSSSISLNQWSHIAVTWGPNVSKLYIDGVVVASVNADVYPSLTDGSNEFYAYLNDWGGSTFSGLIDEFNISKVQESDQEILQHATVALPDIVTNTADSGPGSLRQAILIADTIDSVPETISFNIPTTDPGYANGVFTIQPLTQLPVLLQNITIDGTTQTAFTGNTNPYGPVIVLNGAKQASGDGLELDDNNTVKDLDINGFQGTGINMEWTFSSNGYTNNDNQILDNYIGTDPTGTIAVPNGAGLGIVGWGSPSWQSTGNLIQGNLISGNLFSGIVIGDTNQTQILDNLIGTDRTGTANLGNGADGIGFDNAGAPSNTIEGNTIAFNGRDGIVDAPDYRYSVAYTTSGHQGNAFLQNSIFSNGMLGIDLLAPGTDGNVDAPQGVPLQNTPGGPHQGANLLQNYPVLTSAISSTASTVITGSLNSTPNETFHLEFFASPTANASGYGEGKTYLGATSVTTDASGNASFSVTVPEGNLAGQVLSSTATDPGNNTSEFSEDLQVQAGTSTNIISSVNPSVYGQSVTFTATVGNGSGSGGTPTGSVEFYDGSTDLGTGTPLSGSGTSATSTFSIATLTAGTHSISTVYTATGVFAGSTGTLSETVNQAVLTVSGITAATKVYNASTTAALNTSGATLVGVISGDTVNLNTGGATGTFASQNVGTGITVTVAGLTISGAQASDYTLTQPTTTANITPAGLTVSGITAANKVYNANTTAALNTSGATLVGLLSGDTVNLNTGGASGTFASKNVGTGITVTVAGLTISGAQASDYTLTQPTTTANITPATLTVSGITAANKVYNANTTAALNTSGATLVGVISGDTVNLSTGGATGTFASENVGTGITVKVAGLTISGAQASDYTLTHPTTTANITPATPTVSVNDSGGTYNGSAFNATVTVAGVSGQAASKLEGIAPTLVYYAGSTATGTPLSAAPIDAGTYAVVAHFPGSADYLASTSAPVTFTIAPATPTITWENPANIIYGTSLSSTQLDATASVPGSFVYGPALGTVLHAGSNQTLTVTFTPTDTTDYNKVKTTVQINVTPAPLTITANNATKVYGAVVPTLTYTVKGFVNGDTTKNLTMAPTLTTKAEKSSGVWSYAIVISGGTDRNYTITDVNGTLTVTPAPLTITADNKTKVVGTANPTLTYTVKGFVNGDTTKSLTKPPTLTTTATRSSKAGSYPITVSGAVDPNYTIKYVNGKLTVYRP